MQARVTQRLNEAVPGPVFYPAAEITAALNEAQRFFCLLTLCLEKTSVWSVPTFAANGSIPFFRMLTYFTDWIAPLRIATTVGVKVRPASLESLTALDSGWWNSPGTPSRYAALGGDFLALYQQFAAGGTLNVTYARAPVNLTLSGDVPEIRPAYHPALVPYAINRLRQVEGGQEFAKTLPLLNEFLMAAKTETNYVRARNRASQYDAMPFELEAFDLSKLLALRKDPPKREVAA